ncbi:hypothetical protein Q3G72_009782 [Acer saccharum]|nr:hypothetical protein Q3G72_009782 [Acer saccharum]
MDKQTTLYLSKLSGSEHDGVVEEITRAAETLGFFTVVNHEVPIELLKKLEDTAHSFFRQAPEKRQCIEKEQAQARW